MNPELARLSPNDVSEHYQRYAEIQGRISCEYDRAEGLQNLLQKRYMANKILEIGPFDNPFCLGEYEGNESSFFPQRDGAQMLYNHE